MDDRDEILSECLSELADAKTPASELEAAELVKSTLENYELPMTKSTGRASLTALCLEYLNGLPESTIKLDRPALIKMLRLIGASYNNFNTSDSTQERDMSIFRSFLTKKYGATYAKKLFADSKLSNTKRTLAHLAAAKSIRNERHKNPYVITMSKVYQLINTWSKLCLSGGVVPDEICLLVELCTGARSGEVIEFSTFEVVSETKTLTTIRQTGVLKQGDKSKETSITKPLLLGVNGKSLFKVLDKWRPTNKQDPSNTNVRMNKLLVTYLPGITTHMLRAIYAHVAYDTIVKKGLLSKIVTLNQFLQESLGHHSFEVGLSYLHVVVVNDLAEQPK